MVASLYLTREELELYIKTCNKKIDKLKEEIAKVVRELERRGESPCQP